MYLQNKMNFVPFDHKVHETYNDTCRICHHGSLKPCNDCHTLAGAKEGEGIQLEKAMHQVNTNRSCQGCHNIKQDEKNCAGCHLFISKNRKQQDESCLKCHMFPVPQKGEVQSPEQEKTIAAGLLKDRKPITGTYKEEDVPAKVEIKNLSNKYEAVEFPHRKIVNAIVTNLKDDKLAGYMHVQEGTICQGCHHNSPVVKNPPGCRNCHVKPFDEKNLFKPGIIGAYHQQCMGCHKEMFIAKPAGCTECHKEKINKDKSSVN
jgi:hypothetical protein